jgi:hypothetical protein
VDTFEAFGMFGSLADFGVEQEIRRLEANVRPILVYLYGPPACGKLTVARQLAELSLIDAPAVLGGQRWADISTEYNMGLVVQLIDDGIALGRIPPQPAVPLARILLGAVREGALYLAGAPDPGAAREQVGAVLNGVIDSIGRAAQLATRAPGRLGGGRLG